MKTYHALPKDYTGCQKVIKKFLKDDKQILCTAHNSYECIHAEVMIVDFNPNIQFKYIDSHGRVWDKAVPVETKWRIKKASEIIKWCEDNGWTPDDEGAFWNDTHTDAFIPEMFECCGEDLGDHTDKWDWRKEWLEKVD